MSPWLVVPGNLLLLAVAYASWRGLRCNARRLAHARRTPPLDGLDLGEVTVGPITPPRHWPAVADVTSPADAAAYSSLADDHRLTGAIVGELLVVVGGAAVGVWLPNLFDAGLFVAGCAGLFGAIVGIGLCLRANRVWASVATQYAARYTELTAKPAPSRGAGVSRRTRRTR